jgi:hypothetical protein
LSVRVCPALRRNAVAVRAGSFPLAGVHGALYRMRAGAPVFVDELMVEFGDPLIRWMRAAHLIRRLRDCVLLPVDAITS